MRLLVFKATATIYHVLSPFKAKRRMFSRSFGESTKAEATHMWPACSQKLLLERVVFFAQKEIRLQADYPQFALRAEISDMVDKIEGNYHAAHSKKYVLRCIA